MVMEEMSAKMYNGQDRNDKKNKKVEINLGKNGGIFILLAGGVLVSALVSSVFGKRRKSGDNKDENHAGSTPLESVAAEEEAEEEEDENNTSDDEDQVRKGLQFIITNPSSIMQDNLRIKDGEDYNNVNKEMNETVEKDVASEEQDSPANNQDVISNTSSIPGSATSSEQEYTSHLSLFDNHGLLDHANNNNGSEEGTPHTENFLAANVDEAMKADDVMPADEPEEIKMDLCEGIIEDPVLDEQNAMNSLEMQRNDDEKNTISDQLSSEITHLEDINVLSDIKPEIEINNYLVENYQQCDEVSTTTEENANNSDEPGSGEENIEEDIITLPTIQFVEKQYCDDYYCKGEPSILDDTTLAQREPTMIEEEEVVGNDEEQVINPSIHLFERKLCKDYYMGGDIVTDETTHHILSSNDIKGDEIDDNDDDDVDISEEIMEESSDGSAGTSSDESSDDVEILPAEPRVQDGLRRRLKAPNNVNNEIEEGCVKYKTSNNSKQQITSDCGGGELNMNCIVQSGMRRLAILDNLVTRLLESKQKIVAGIVTLLVVYSCFLYFDLPFLKPTLVGIAASFLSNFLAL